MKSRFLALALVLAIATPMLAAPGDDSPRGGSVLTKIVRVIKHVLAPLDDLIVPHP